MGNSQLSYSKAGKDFPNTPLMGSKPKPKMPILQCTKQIFFFCFALLLTYVEASHMIQEGGEDFQKWLIDSSIMSNEYHTIMLYY